MEQNAILIVDDDVHNRELIKHYLVHDSYTLLEARDGLEAKNLAGSMPDLKLVLMDINMPVMNGIESLRHIRESHPDLPVIAVTASIEEFSHELCKGWGFDDLLLKPFNRCDLREMITRHIRT